MEIKIVRLLNGEDIIGQIIEESTADKFEYKVIEPMTVDIEYRGKESGLVMRHWLPVQLVKYNEITIKDKDVLCIFDAADEFAEYYVNTVEKMHDLLKAKNLVDEMSDEDINNIMDAIEQQDGYTLH